MVQKILSTLASLLIQVLRWFVRKSKLGWRYELKRIRTGENRWLRVIPNRILYISLCIVMVVILFPILVNLAFTSNWSLGLSFTFSAILAVSFGYILRNPMLLIVIYVLVIFRREVTGLFGIVKDTALTGDILGTVVLVGLISYLLWWVKHIERELA